MTLMRVHEVITEHIITLASSLFEKYNFVICDHIKLIAAKRAFIYSFSNSPTKDFLRPKSAYEATTKDVAICVSLSI